MKEVRKMKGRERKIHYKESEFYPEIVEDSLRARLINVR